MVELSTDEKWCSRMGLWNRCSSKFHAHAGRHGNTRGSIHRFFFFLSFSSSGGQRFSHAAERRNTTSRLFFLKLARMCVCVCWSSPRLCGSPSLSLVKTHMAVGVRKKNLCVYYVEQRRWPRATSFPTSEHFSRDQSLVSVTGSTSFPS